MALLILKVKVIVDQEGQSTLRALHAVVYQNIVGIAVRRCRGHNMDEEQYNYAHECSEVFYHKKGHDKILVSTSLVPRPPHSFCREPGNEARLVLSLKRMCNQNKSQIILC